mgnify:CR=1 FL=1
MKNPAIETLIEAIESVNSLTVWYLYMLKDPNINKNFEVNGIKLNNVFWLTAHLANSENLLLLKALGAKAHHLDWLKDYSFGSSKDEIPTISYEEVKISAKKIHLDSIAYLRSLSDEDLTKENLIGFDIASSKSFKSVIMHHIRHEGIHVGQLVYYAN